MKKITLSIVLFFLLLVPRLTCAEEVHLPFDLEWGSSPETVFSILKNKCKPTYNKENRSIGCLIIGHEIYDTYLIFCKFDKYDKLKYINKSVYVFGDGSYEKNMSAANIYMKLTSHFLQEKGMVLESTEEEKEKDIHHLSSLSTLITMDIQPGDDSHNSFFKDKVVVVNMLYIDPAFHRGPQGETISEAARIAEELKNLRK